MDRLKSRKLWVSLVTAAVVVLAETLGLKDEQLKEIVAIAIGYLVTQGYVDGKAAA